MGNVERAQLDFDGVFAGRIVRRAFGFVRTGRGGLAFGGGDILLGELLGVVRPRG